MTLMLSMLIAFTQIRYSTCRSVSSVHADETGEHIHKFQKFTTFAQPVKLAQQCKQRLRRVVVAESVSPPQKQPFRYWHSSSCQSIKITILCPLDTRRQPAVHFRHFPYVPLVWLHTKGVFATCQQSQLTLQLVVLGESIPNSNTDLEAFDANGQSIQHCDHWNGWFWLSLMKSECLGVREYEGDVLEIWITMLRRPKFQRTGLQRWNAVDTNYKCSSRCCVQDLQYHVIISAVIAQSSKSCIDGQICTYSLCSRCIWISTPNQGVRIVRKHSIARTLYNGTDTIQWHGQFILM